MLSPSEIFVLLYEVACLELMTENPVGLDKVLEPIANGL